MVIFVLAKIISTGSAYEGIITKITEVTMILMLITGLVMFVQSKWHKKKGSVKK